MTQNSTRYVRDEKPLYSADSMASMALRQKCVNEGDESNLASHILSQMYWIAYHIPARHTSAYGQFVLLYQSALRDA